MRISFQNAVTPVMEGIVDFHHDTQYYLIMIVTFVTWMLFAIVYEYGYKLYINSRNALDEVLENRKLILFTKEVTHGVILEIVWTLLPVIILIWIAIPSFALLYSIDEVIDPSLTVKVIGHQWYWSYEYTDFESNSIMYDSYMIPETDLQLGERRLLAVDRLVWFPVNTHIRVLITAVDVLHCWALPSFGVKMDAIPGRLNQVAVFSRREGVFYGQCSELCGVNHGFMPVSVKVVPLKLFEVWTAQLAKVNANVKKEIVVSDETLEPKMFMSDVFNFKKGV
jgi:cytochrome c oxidase subunit 2